MLDCFYVFARIREPSSPTDSSIFINPGTSSYDDTGSLFKQIHKLTVRIEGDHKGSLALGISLINSVPDFTPSHMQNTEFRRCGFPSFKVTGAAKTEIKQQSKPGK